MLNALLLFLQLKGLNTSKIQLFLEQVLILMSKSDNYGSETEQYLFS